MGEEMSTAEFEACRDAFMEQAPNPVLAGEWIGWKAGWRAGRAYSEQLESLRRNQDDGSVVRSDSQPAEGAPALTGPSGSPAHRLPPRLPPDLLAQEGLTELAEQQERANQDRADRWQLRAERAEQQLAYGRQRITDLEEYGKELMLRVDAEATGRAETEQELELLREALQAYTDHDSMFYVLPLLGAKHAREALARSSRETSGFVEAGEKKPNTTTSGSSE